MGSVILIMAILYGVLLLVNNKIANEYNGMSPANQEAHSEYVRVYCWVRSFLWADGYGMIVLSILYIVGRWFP